MKSAVEVAYDEISVEHLLLLLAEKQRLEQTIEVTSQIVQFRRRSVLADRERLKGRPLSLDEQLGTTSWRDLDLLNSLDIDLEIVIRKIAFVNASQLAQLT